MGPIKDANEFAKKITFGRVDSVKDNIISIYGQRLEAPPTEPIARSLRSLGRPSPVRKLFAVKTLLTTPPNERRAEVLKALEPLLDDPDTNMQTSAAEAYCAWATKENGPTLVKFLKNERLRGRAIEALTRLKDERAIGPISECLSGFVGQGEAKAALIAFGPAAEDVVLKLFEHSDHRVRAIACEIAQKTKSARAIDPIAECIVHTDSRNQASEALVAFGSMAEDAVIKLLGQSDPNVRALACEMLIKIGTQKCLPALEQTTQDLDRNVNTTAKNALLQITKRLSGAPG